MNYILKGENDIYNPIDQVLKNRGLTDDIFYLDNSAVEDHYNFDNINEGVELLVKHIENNSNILIVGDSDTDGLTSYAILYKYIKNEYPNCNLNFTIHTGKQHGLSNDITIGEEVKLIILPDASSNDYEQHKYYKDKGIDILVIDHHDAEYYSENAVVINNQLSDKIRNKNLSGVGVTYKFLKAMDDYLFTDNADYYLDLVALGNIADVMVMSEPETRYLSKLGMEQINNTFLKALIETNEFDLDSKYNYDKVAWTIAPKLNGVIRSGTFEEKLALYGAFVSDDYDYCLEIAKKCKNIKSRQDNAVKSGINKMKIKLRFEAQDRVLICDASKLNSSYTGLVAGKLTDMYGVPVLLYRNVDDNLVAGSGRGYDNITTTFKEDLLNSGLMEMAQGHEGAFGWSCSKDSIEELKSYLNELYKDKDVVNSKIYEVDFELEEYEIEYNFIMQLGELENEWSKGIEVPLIAFRDISLELDQSNVKGKLNIVFDVNGIKFIKKFSSNELKSKILNKEVVADIIGKCVVDSFTGDYIIEVTDFLIK